MAKIFAFTDYVTEAKAAVDDIKSRIDRLHGGYGPQVESGVFYALMSGALPGR